MQITKMIQEGESQMHSTIRNILAVIGGIILGGVVNMGIVMISGNIIPPPGGADVTTLEGLKSSIHLFEPRHFIFPFLAHALGTLVGAGFTAKLAASQRTPLALVIGAFFLIGGAVNVMLLPSPMWFNVLDLVGAYFPMAWLGARLASGIR